MKELSVAVVGVGYWGPNLVRNFLKIPGVKIASICDINEKNLQKMRHDYPFLKTTLDFKTVLNDPSISLVAIATPPSTHFSLAKMALNAGKHVFIEKPMTQTSDQAKKLLKIAQRKRKILMVGHTFLYSSAVQKIKDYIDKKELGKIYYYDSTRINLGGFQSDTDVLWDLATHDLAILLYIFPEKVLSVSVTASRHRNKKYVEVAHIFL